MRSEMVDESNPLAWVFFTLMSAGLSVLCACVFVITAVVWFVSQPLKWFGVID